MYHLPEGRDPIEHSYLVLGTDPLRVQTNGNGRAQWGVKGIRRGLSIKSCFAIRLCNYFSSGWRTVNLFIWILHSQRIVRVL
jgi:hypothetical protein